MNQDKGKEVADQRNDALREQLDHLMSGIEQARGNIEKEEGAEEDVSDMLIEDVSDEEHVFSIAVVTLFPFSVRDRKEIINQMMNITNGGADYDVNKYPDGEEGSVDEAVGNLAAMVSFLVRDLDRNERCKLMDTVIQELKDEGIFSEEDDEEESDNA